MRAEVQVAQPESRWLESRNNPDCRDASLWHSVDKSQSEVEVSIFFGGLVRLLQPEFVVETGSHKGQTTCMIGQALVTNGHGHCTALEVVPRYARSAASRCKELPVTVLCESSLEWMPMTVIDLLFCDTMLLTRAKEIRRYHHWLRPSSVIVIHDAKPVGRVKDTVDELVAEQLVQPPIYFPTPRGLCMTKPICTSA